MCGFSITVIISSLMQAQMLKDPIEPNNADMVVYIVTFRL